MPDFAVAWFRPFRKLSSAFFVVLAVPALLLITLASAQAEPQWLSTFTSRYPSATRLATCGVCHTNFNQNSSRNDYGNAFRAAGGATNANAAMAAIEGDDSDGDGTTNIDEIQLMTGFMPGYDCTTYTATVNAPANLADYVDPTNVGCLAVTTTSSTTSTTTSTSTSTTTSTTTSTSTTTTTTVPVKCAQPVSLGALPSATDCLYILQAAVFIQTCDPVCVCAPKGTLPTSATDALICLKKATGQAVTLNCPC